MAMNLEIFQQQLNKKKISSIWKIVGYKDNADQLKEIEAKIISEQNDRFENYHRLVNLSNNSENLKLREFNIAFNQNLFKIKIIGKHNDQIELVIREFKLDVT